LLFVLASCSEQSNKEKFQGTWMTTSSECSHGWGKEFTIEGNNIETEEGIFQTYKFTDDEQIHLTTSVMEDFDPDEGEDFVLQFNDDDNNKATLEKSIEDCTIKRADD